MGLSLVMITHVMYSGTTTTEATTSTTKPQMPRRLFTAAKGQPAAGRRLRLLWMPVVPGLPDTRCLDRQDTR